MKGDPRYAEAASHQKTNEQIEYRESAPYPQE